MEAHMAISIIDERRQQMYEAGCVSHGIHFDELKIKVKLYQEELAKENIRVINNTDELAEALNLFLGEKD